MARDFIMPKYIITGEGAVTCADLHQGEKAFIVTDPVMVKLGNVEKIIKELNKINVKYEVYDSIVGEPTDEMIMEGAKKYEENDCDFLIAIGGGSPIDSMKAIAMVVSSGKHINEFLGQEIKIELPFMIAIPTTAGTGSEATQFTIITNTKDDIKMLLKSTALVPGMAIIDPQFTLSAPSSVTAATGLDALCHAVESYISRKAQPLSKTFSISALKRILEYLPIAYHDGKNVKAREEMSIAALEAGIAFNNSSVTLIHGMSRPIGALYHVPHGLSNAMLISECFAYIIEDAYEEFGILAKEVGVANEKDDLKLAAEKLLNIFQKLIQECEVPTLTEYGVEKENFLKNIKKMAKDAIDSGSPANTKKECTLEDIETLYRHVINT